VADDADFAADLVERERQALIARHLRRQPPPAPPPRRAPAHLSQVMDEGPNA
jgi:hypothetical protein